MSLLHQDDGGLRVPATGVGLEVFLHCGGGGFLLILIGMLPNPEEDLWRAQELCQSSLSSWPPHRPLFIQTQMDVQLWTLTLHRPIWP